MDVIPKPAFDGRLGTEKFVRAGNVQRGKSKSMDHGKRLSVFNKWRAYASTALHNSDSLSKKENDTTDEIKQNSPQLRREGSPQIVLKRGTSSYLRSNNNRFANVVATVLKRAPRREAASVDRGYRSQKSDISKTSESDAHARRARSLHVKKQHQDRDISSPVSCPDLDSLHRKAPTTDGSYAEGSKLNYTSDPYLDEVSSNIRISRDRMSSEKVRHTCDTESTSTYSPQSAKRAASRQSIPDIFVTSYTSNSRSSSSQQLRAANENGSFSKQTVDGRSDSVPLTRSQDYINRNVHRGSVPNLKGGCHRPISKSASDTLAQAMKDSSEFTMFLTESASKKCKGKPRYIQLWDKIYVGNLECAYNEPLKCKLGIGSILDLSNVVPEMVPSHKKWDVPCVCGRSSHMQAILRLGLCLTEKEELPEHFRKINKFVTGALTNNKNVLIVCYSGTSISAIVSLQYLLSNGFVSFTAAKELAKEKLSHVPLDLLSWELLKQTLALHDNADDGTAGGEMNVYLNASMKGKTSRARNERAIEQWKKAHTHVLNRPNRAKSVKQAWSDK